MVNGMKPEMVFCKAAGYPFSNISYFADNWHVNVMVGAGAATLEDEVKGHNKDGEKNKVESGLL